MDPGEFVDTSYINDIPMVSNRIAFLNIYPPTSKITSSRKRMHIDIEQQKEEEKEKQFPKMDTVKEVWKKKNNKKNITGPKYYDPSPNLCLPPE